MKSNFKIQLLLVVLVITACDPDPKPEISGQDDVDFCSCLTLEDIHKTIPLVNEFLTKLPDATSKEETFISLEEWMKTFPCDMDAKIFFGIDFFSGQNNMRGVSFRVDDNGTRRELELDFAIIDNALTYSQIAGYLYYKQDAINVKAQLTEIEQVFQFINEYDFDIKVIQGGIYLSSLPASPIMLENIVNNLKAKPYTNETWVNGHLNWYGANIAVLLRLYFMENPEYQTDWLLTMQEYKLENYASVSSHIVEFYIPEGTGEQWEAYFTEIDFVDWAELSYTRYTIR